MLNKVKIHLETRFSIYLFEYLGDTDEVELEFYLTTPFASGRNDHSFLIYIIIVLFLRICIC